MISQTRPKRQAPLDRLIINNWKAVEQIMIRMPDQNSCQDGKKSSDDQLQLKIDELSAERDELIHLAERCLLMKKEEQEASDKRR